MEYFLLIVVIILLIIVLSGNSRNRTITEMLLNNMRSLSDEIKQLRHELRHYEKTDTQQWAPKREADREAEHSPESIPDEPISPRPVYNPAPVPPPPPPPEERKPEPIPQRTYIPAGTTLPAEPTESWWTRWMRNNPDLEKFIGENLINKIGIAVLVLGIAFFVKYAIDKNWINEAGRVCIGLLCGIILAGFGHFLRKNYRSFSSVLAGGGIAVFYFTIAFAFHQYALFGQTAAFLIMVVITIFAVLLSLLYDRLELAVIATIGGFITPLLVSTGQGNYIVLFTYLAVLNAGLLILSFYKRWTLINIISLFFTILLYSGWYQSTMGKIPVPFSYPLALLFASIFYLLFLSMNIAYQVRFKTPFKAFEFSILLLINAWYFTMGMLLLHSYHEGDYQGLFTAAMGCINLGLAYWYFRKPEADKRLLYLLIGLTLTFLSLAIPVQLHGHTITLFWSAEFVLLYWLYQRSKISLFRLSSILVAILSLGSLLIDWVIAASNATTNLFVIYTDLQGFVTNLVSVGAFVSYYLLLRKQQAAENIGAELRIKESRSLSLIIAALLLYITSIFGVNLLLGQMNSYSVPNVYHRLITQLFVLVLFLLSAKNENRLLQNIKTVMVFGCAFYYVASIDLIIGLRDLVLAGKYSNIHLVTHWVDMGLLLFLFYKMIQLVRSRQSENSNFLSWMISASIVVIFSLECLHLFVMIGFNGNNVDQLTRHYSKAGLDILWGICSFVMMWLGMKHKYKPLRIISLSLFAIVLLKLFLFDIRGVSEGGKIAAFISLGVLLLVVSFMYQKLKMIIIDDKE